MTRRPCWRACRRARTRRPRSTSRLRSARRGRHHRDPLRTRAPTPTRARPRATPESSGVFPNRPRRAASPVRWRTPETSGRDSEPSTTVRPDGARRHRWGPPSAWRAAASPCPCRRVIAFRQVRPRVARHVQWLARVAGDRPRSGLTGLRPRPRRLAPLLSRLPFRTLAQRLRAAGLRPSELHPPGPPPRRSPKPLACRDASPSHRSPIQFTFSSEHRQMSPGSRFSSRSAFASRSPRAPRRVPTLPLTRSCGGGGVRRTARADSHGRDAPRHHRHRGHRARSERAGRGVDR